VIFRARAAIPVFAIITLSACTAAPPAPSAAPEPEPVSAQDTCDQVGNITTLLFNLGVAYSEGRVSEQELEGAKYLASSMASFVQVDSDSVLAAQIEALKATPVEDIPVLYGPQSSSSEEWNVILDELGANCKELGAEFGVMAWTGG
jgi:hypothetical protein